MLDRTKSKTGQYIVFKQSHRKRKKGLNKEKSERDIWTCFNIYLIRIGRQKKNVRMSRSII